MGKRKKIDPIRIFRRNNRHGNLITIQGPIRRGKSYLTSIFIKELLNDGFHIITNFQFTAQALARNPKIHYVKGATELFRAYTTIPDLDPWILVLDDIQAIKGTSTLGSVQSKEYGSFSGILMFLGKLQGNGIFITHLDYHPKAYINMETIFIFKYTKADFIITGTRQFKNKRERYKKGDIVKVPNVKPIPYITEGIGFFKFDIDLQDLWHYLADKDPRDMKKWILEYLDQVEDQARDRELKELSFSDIVKALWFKRPDLKGSDKLHTLIPNKALYSTLKGLKDR